MDIFKGHVKVNGNIPTRETPSFQEPPEFEVIKKREKGENILTLDFLENPWIIGTGRPP